jgi:hypothetical protein
MGRQPNAQIRASPSKNKQKAKPMTKTHFTSKDQIVEVLITTDDNRYPRHAAPMTVVKLRPRPHSRCREQWGGITLMLTFPELRAIAQAIKLCDPKFDFTMSKTAVAKPEWLKKRWQKRNYRRVRGVKP